VIANAIIKIIIKEIIIIIISRFYHRRGREGPEEE